MSSLCAFYVYKLRACVKQDHIRVLTSEKRRFYRGYQLDSKRSEGKLKVYIKEYNFLTLVKASLKLHGAFWRSCQEVLVASWECIGGVLGVFWCCRRPKIDFRTAWPSLKGSNFPYGKRRFTMHTSSAPCLLEFLTLF